MRQLFSISCFLILFLSGCVMIGPKYKRPDVPMPEEYQGDISKPDKEADLAYWWTHFNDPTLNELIAKALDANFDLLIALEKIEETRAQFQIKKADLLPLVSVNGQATRNQLSRNLVLNSFLTNDTISIFEFGFDAIWELDFFGKLRHAKNAALYDYQAQIEDMRNVLLMVLSEVSRTYIDIRAFEKKIQLTRKKIKIDTALLQLIDDTFMSGLESQTPYYNQKQLLDTSKNELKALQIGLQISSNQLAFLLGENPEGFRLKKSCRIPMSTKRIEPGLPSDLLKRRPDIQQAERQIAAATERVGQAITEWFPQFSLIGGLGTASSKGSLWFSNGSLTWYIGPSLSWPLINFGRIRANIDAKESVERQAILAYSQTIINALKEVENFLVTYFDQQQQLSILTDKKNAARANAQLSCDRFSSGLDSEINYLLSTKNFIDRAFEVADAQQAVSTTLISLYKALAGGW